MKYRTRPKVVDAFQWRNAMGECGPVIRDHAREGMQAKGSNKLFYCVRVSQHRKLSLDDGDWVVREDGKYRVMDQTEFHAVYEALDEGQS